MSDNSNFEKIFREQYSYLFNLSNKTLNDRFAAEDIVQNVFLSIWKKRSEIKIQTSLKSYLSRAVINACYDYLKKSNRIVPISEKDHSKSNTDTEDYLAHSELKQNLDEAIDKLPARCRIIFTLSRFEGLTSAQIAEHMGLSKKTVDNQIGIALQKLRDELKSYISLKTMVFISILLLLLL